MSSRGTVNPLGITMGDPAGIGPEVLMRTLHVRASERPPLVLIGSRWALAEGAAAAGLPEPDLPEIATPGELDAGVGIIDIGIKRPAGFRFGAVDAACGAHAVLAVERAAELCMAGRLAAMVTAPINKEAVHAAGYVDDIGHQEILARITQAALTATMLMTPGLRVVHLSTHKPLTEAARYVTRGNVLAKLRLADRSLSGWGLPRARIAVAALNPHGGEGGMLGREEIEELGPAVGDARARGIDAQGPIPADSVFNRAIAGEFDAVLALYHDQGHIAVKVHDFHGSTTATLGIPFVRTSVDHGTAFDIAGLGRADPRGMAAALDAATALVEGRLASLWPAAANSAAVPAQRNHP
ncbi:MAG: 4-hydroxythreonine-4-phosphate dehydrogenase PdxA [Gammaproteobacteria bacterium]|nr:4-hydroxythreonine-4-phosphate dehydrogenase PdxA [Gammaproteobacteria bacterium]